MTGQDAVNTAKVFHDTLNFDGVILTKLDGDTRGGAALSIKTVVDKPIKFIGTGEKMEALDIFYPERMADRILGMGDVVSLVERAQEQFDQDEARKISKKIAKNQFSFDDFLSQIQQVKKMGNMKDLIGMIPGAGSVVNKLIDQLETAIKQAVQPLLEGGATLPGLNLGKDAGGLESTGYVYIGEDPDSQGGFDVEDVEGQREFTTVKLIRDDIEDLL